MEWLIFMRLQGIVYNSIRSSLNVNVNVDIYLTIRPVAVAPEGKGSNFF